MDDRKCFEAILWILWTGAPWSALPKERSTSPATAWRRLQAWERDGALLDLWRAFLDQLDDEDKVRWDECFVDGTFFAAKRGPKVGPTKRGEGTKSMVLVDGTGAPLGVYLDAASPAEVPAPRVDRQPPEEFEGEAAEGTGPSDHRARRDPYAMVPPQVLDDLPAGRGPRSTGPRPS